MSTASHRVPDQSAPVTIRRRRSSDVAELARLLLAQQAQTRYPLRDPLPIPVERFLHAEDAEAAWVAEADGRVVGNVCRLASPSGRADAGSMAQICAQAHGCDVGDLGWVSTLFVDLRLGGLGVGRHLLDTVVSDLVGDGRRPCLEVLPLHAAALALYESRGWRTVAGTRPEWMLAALGADGPDVRLMVLDEY